MDKKKFYIILLSIVVVAVVSYAIIFLIGVGNNYNVDPKGGEVSNNEGVNDVEKRDEVISSETMFSSMAGDVVESNGDVLRVSVQTLDGGTSFVEIDNLADIDNISGVKIGDNISIRLTENLSSTELENGAVNVSVEEIVVNPPDVKEVP